MLSSQKTDMAIDFITLIVLSKEPLYSFSPEDET